ncbi:MAG: glycosyltransferase [Deltaproteobacteria bacterium]|nr:glycosyltransferase [Deltaproteobacteria bacterium]
MKSKVLVVTQSYPGPGSPVSGIFVRDQAETLKHRYEVAVLVLLPRWVSGRGLLGFKGLPKVKVADEGGITVFRQEVLLPAEGRFRILEPPLWVLAGLGVEKAAKAWKRPDIIHAHVAWPAGWAATGYARMAGLPLVITEHTGPFSSLMKNPAMSRTVGRVFKKADRVLAVSPDLTDQMRKFFPDLPITVIGNVIRTDIFAPETGKKSGPKRRFRFLSVALLDPAKGMDYLLEAARTLLDRGVKGFSVTIAGDGPALPGLKEKAKNLDLTGVVDFPGMILRDELVRELNLADAFVLPSLGETFSVVLGEAGACGVPVIATRCGGPEFVVTPETGILVPKADSKALAEAMKKMISGKLTFDSAAIRNCIVSRFGPEAFLDNIGRVYSSLSQS